MKGVSRLFSVFFHPLFLVYGLVLFAYWIDRYAYFVTEGKEVGAIMIMNFFILVLFPAVGVALLVGTKMISGFTMTKREDRIGPLIITLTCYIWFFVNVNANQSFPDSLRFVALGIVLSTGFAFFINNFSKISLHTVGAGSFCTALISLLFLSETSFILIQLPLAGGFRVSSIFVLFWSIIIAGAIGSARLFLGSHEPQEIYGGYIAGISSQIIALAIIM